MRPIGFPAMTDLWGHCEQSEAICSLDMRLLRRPIGLLAMTGEEVIANAAKQSAACLQCHCERSEAICSLGVRLLHRPIGLLAMTGEGSLPIRAPRNDK